MMLQRVGFWLGLSLFSLLLWLPAPEGLSESGWRVAALTLLIACWWFTEAVPVTLTGSLPFLALPLLDVGSAQTVAGQYMSPVLFLILGGSLVGLAFEKWNLHRRVAIYVVSRVSPEPAKLLLGIMFVTALVSLFVNNSATTVMMLPIAMATLVAVVSTGKVDASGVMRYEDINERQFAAAMILCVSLASNIGGFATPIGTPVNSIAVGVLDRTFDVQISFAQWMTYGIPFMLLGIPACWWVMTRWTLRFELPALSRERIRHALGDPGPLSGPQWRVLLVVGVVAAAWVFQPLLQPFFPKLTDAGIAIGGALLVCILPSGERDARGQSIRLLDWDEARRAPWYLILLLGGGLALADAVVKSGLSAWLGTSLEAVSGLPMWSMVFAIALMCSLITEAASNVATATIFMPIAASLALGAGYDPIIAALAAAMAANLGFANPAATSSNALVYSTGQVPIAAMIRTGLIFDVIGAVLITLLVLIVVPVLHLS